MKANQLRINNIVLRDGVIHTVNALDIHTQSQCDLDQTTYLHDIALTEQWLIKLGLKRKDQGLYYIREEYYSILIVVDTFDVVVDWREEGFYVPLRHNVKYVHQLQNIYFDLMDETLVIRP